jgi:hypothetical protein
VPDTVRDEALILVAVPAVGTARRSGLAFFATDKREMDEASPAALMVHARVDGSFQRSGETWWWSVCSTVHYVGDLSGHIRGGLG